MKKNSSQVKLVWTLAKPYSLWLALDCFIMLCNAALAMYFPWLIGEWVMTGEWVITLTELITYGSIVGAMWMLKGLTGFQLRRKSHKMIGKFRSKMYAHMLYYPIKFFNSQKVEELTGTIVDDSLTVRDFIFSDVTNIFVNTITVMGCTGMLFSIDPNTAGVMIAGIPICIMLMLPLKKKIYNNFKRQKESNLKMRSYLNDTFDNIAQVKSSGQEKVEGIRGKKIFRSETRALRAQRILESILSPVTTIIGIGLFLVVGGYAVERIINDYIDFGGVISFALYFSVIVTEVVGIIIAMTRRNRIGSILDRVGEVYMKEEEQTLVGETVECIESIALINVQFGYSDELLFTDLSLSAIKGQMVAIVGGSGSGKSTIFSLIEKFYNMSSGEYLINGESSNKFSIKSIRDNIAYVNQSNTLFDGSIRDNLTYGMNKKITDSKLYECLAKTGIEDYVRGLEKGLDNEILDGGKRMSGGQRQKLALSRIILRDYSVLLLDEATASLDSESEALIESYVAEKRKDKLVIMIAHRLSTIANADKIIVLKNGVILAEGKHKQLLAKNDYYKELVNEQFIDVNASEDKD